MKHEATADALERLRIMAKQKTSAELGDEKNDADFEEGYDYFCQESRVVYAALKSIEQPASPDDGDVLVLQMIGRADFLEDRREAKSPGLLRQGAIRIRQLSAQVKALEASRNSALQHVAYFDEGQFHWMSGVAPRDCELYAARKVGKE